MDIYTTLNLKIDETQELIHSNLEAKNNLKQESFENTSQFTNSKIFSRKLCSNFNLQENSSTDLNFLHQSLITARAAIISIHLSYPKVLPLYNSHFLQTKNLGMTII